MPRLLGLGNANPVLLFPAFMHVSYRCPTCAVFCVPNPLLPGPLAHLPAPQDTVLSNPQLYGETMRATRREFMKEQLWWLVLVGGGSRATGQGWAGQTGGGHL